MQDNQTCFVRSIYADTYAQKTEATLFSVKYSEKGHSCKFYNRSFYYIVQHALHGNCISMNIVKLNSIVKSLSLNITLMHLTCILCPPLSVMNFEYFIQHMYFSIFMRNAIKSGLIIRSNDEKSWSAVKRKVNKPETGTKFARDVDSRPCPN